MEMAEEMIGTKIDKEARSMQQQKQQQQQQDRETEYKRDLDGGEPLASKIQSPSSRRSANMSFIRGAWRALCHQHNRTNTTHQIQY